MNEQFAGQNESPDQPINQSQQEPRQDNSISDSGKEIPSADPPLSGGTPSLANIAAAGAKGAALPPQAAPFQADRKDGFLALFALVLGYLFARWVLFYWQGFGVTVFTALFCGAVLWYFVRKGVKMPRAAWFWFALVLITGLCFSLWENNSVSQWRALLLFGGAVYWVICASGVLIQNKTGNWIILDGVNGLLFIPLSNFFNQYIGIAFLGRKKKTEGKKFLSVALGVLLALLVSVMVLPLLMEADSGGFSQLTNGVWSYFQWMRSGVSEFVFYALLSIPISAYLFGLVSGCAHQRGCAAFSKERTQKAIGSLRVLPAATVYTCLGLVSLLYLVYIASQLPYFFSAFAGQRPEGFEVYSEYARRGFFELCRIAALNLSLLTGANILCKKPRYESAVLKLQNSLLSLLTILLILTAMSKMALYIGAYGLSVRRILPCWFMIYLAIVCIGVIVLQKRRFSIMRFSAVLGAVMLCSLCLADPDGIAARYNAGRYLSGTLEGFDVAILNRAGPAGVAPAIEVYEETGDPQLKAQLSDYLYNQQHKTEASRPKTRDSLQTAGARAKITAFAAEHPFVTVGDRSLYLDIG